MSDSGAGVRLALIAVVFWGASFVATRMALEGFTPFGLLSFRLILGVGFLTLLSIFKGKGNWPRTKDCPLLLTLGFILSVHLGIQAIGLQFTTAIHTAWIVGAMPISIALGACLLGRQRFAVGEWIGLSLAGSGILMITVPDIRSPGFLPFEHASLGDILQVSTCVTWTVYTLLAERRQSAKRHYSSREGTVFVMGFAAVVAVLGATLFGWVHGAPSLEAWLSAIFLGVFCSGLAFWLWSEALARSNASKVGLTLFAEPFVTLILAVSILDEPFSEWTIVGGLLVLLGVFFSQRK